MDKQQIASEDSSGKQIVPLDNLRWGESVQTVALMRSLGMFFDFTIATGIALIPVFYLNLTCNGGHYIGFSVPWSILSQRNAAADVGFAIALTPLPICYLRLFIKRLMKSQTPGEMTVGISAHSESSGIEGIIQESLYALSQYVALLLSFILAMIAAGLVAGVQYFLTQNTHYTTHLPSFLLNLLNFLPFFSGISIFVVLLALNCAGSSLTNLKSHFENQLQLDVKRLR